MPLQSAIFRLKERFFAISSCKSILLPFRSEVRENYSRLRFIDNRGLSIDEIKYRARDNVRLHRRRDTTFDRVEWAKGLQKRPRRSGTPVQCRDMTILETSGGDESRYSPHLDSASTAIASRLVRSRVDE